MIARLLALFLLAGSVFAQNVVHYTATHSNVKYLFATVEPVAHLKSGDILDTNTLDCFGNVLKKPGDTLNMVKGDNPLAGPFFVEGADSADSWRASVEAAVLPVGRHSPDPAVFVVISSSRRIIQDIV